ncbi:MAG TPA: hypothetical protein VH109_12635, partial [Steroidobacteraceae bacterium]|nr:hypothetical protein [Steroidobacteraceae bacterium]
EIWRIGKRTPFAGYHYVVYIGGLSLVLHLVKMLSALLLLVSLIGGFDSLFLVRLLPQNVWTNPAYFVGAVGSYLALGVLALFTVVPRNERAYVAPVVPLYLLYALTHLVPMTLGFCNCIALQLGRRRLYRDHYESEPATADDAATDVLRRPFS